MREAKERNAGDRSRVGGVGGHGWMGLILGFWLAAMLLRAWTTEVLTPIDPHAAPPPATWSALDASRLEQSLGLLGLMPLCVRRGALRVKGCR